ncbi:MAG TPA: DUF6134 family protein [Geminicoccaceae bacterium]|nr:DUF6134 family protein [Geminicoccaceae bacterium]
MRLASFLALLIASGGALAAEPASGSYHYRIRHALFGDIGAHEVTVRHEGGRVVVEHRAHLMVRLLGITAHERRSRYREVWQDDRLVAFEGLTVDNNERFEVRARAEGDDLVVEGASGRSLAPAATVPSQPSLAGTALRNRFFDIKTGELLDATVRPAGPEWLKLRDRPVAAEKYEVTGELEQIVWYDATGLFAQWRLWRQGAAITLTRE